MLKQLLNRVVASPLRVSGYFGEVAVDVLALFTGRFGFWYQFETGTVESAPGVVATAGDIVDTAGDSSPNGYELETGSAGTQPVFQETPNRLVMDRVDDGVIVTVPGSGLVGDMVIGTTEGTATYGVSLPSGLTTLGGAYWPGPDITGLFGIEGSLSIKEKQEIEASFGGGDYGGVSDLSAYWRGMNYLTSFPVLDTSSVTNMTNTWRDCSSLTSFPLLDTSSVTAAQAAWRGCSSLASFPVLDTSSVTNMTYAWYACSSLTSFPVLDTSSVTNMTNAWYGCSSLTSFPVLDTSSVTNMTNAWYGCSSLTSFPVLDTSSVTNMTNAWRGCSSLTSFPSNMFDATPCIDFAFAFDNTALTQTSIDNILTSINTAATSNGTFNQSGGSAPSATGEAAITAMRSRGWTISVTGGF